MPTGLYLVSTPLGNSRDITLRALDVLRSVSVIAAEDTRSTRKLLGIHDIPLKGRRLLSYGEHNARRQRHRILELLDRGTDVALVSEAGTPLISDPGHRLVSAAIEAGHSCHPIPGPSAVTAAVSVSGLASDRFLFAGFLPAKAGQRKTALADLASIPNTLVFFEAPHRLKATLDDIGEALGNHRRAAICRELTKFHESIMRGTVAELAAGLGDRLLGECTIVVEGAHPPASDPIAIERHLTEAMARLSLRDAVSEVAAVHGASRVEIYGKALAIRRRTGEP